MNTIRNLTDFNQYGCFTLSPNKHIRGIVEMNEHLWIATESGIVRLDAETGETHTFNKSNSPLSSYTIEGIALLPNQPVTGGTAQHRDVIGVIHYEGRIGLIQEDGTSNRVNDSSETDVFDQSLAMAVQQQADGKQVIWVGLPAVNSGEKGLVKVSDSDWRNPTSIDFFTEKTVRYLLVSRDNTKVWAVTPDAVFLSSDNGTNWSDVPINYRRGANDRNYGNPASGVFPLTIENIHTIYEAQNGALYIGTPKGVYQYNEECRGFLPFGQFSEAVLAMVENKNRLLLGSSSGLYYVNGHAFMNSPSAPIRTLHKDSSNTIWVGFLRNGLYRLEQQNLAKQPLANFSGDFMLPKNTIDTQSATIGNRMYTITSNNTLVVSIEEGGAIEINPECISGGKILEIAATTSAEGGVLWVLAEAVNNSYHSAYDNSSASLLIHALSTKYLEALTKPVEHIASTIAPNY